VPSRQSEVEKLRAALAAERAERERLADKLASVLDHVYAANVLPPAAGGETGPLPRVQRPAHRTPKAQRWLWPVPCVLAAAGFRLAEGVKVKAATTGLAMTGVTTITVLSLTHVHTLENRERIVYVPPGSSVPSIPDSGVPVRVVLPTARLSSDPKPLAGVKAPVKVLVKLPAVVPVVTPSPAPVAAPSQDTSSWSGSDSSSQPDSSPDWQQSSGWQQSYQSSGRHASRWSGEGDSGYRGRHGDNGRGDNYWQQGDGGQWQGSQQGGGNWQGGGHGNHGDH